MELNKIKRRKNVEQSTMNVFIKETVSPVDAEIKLISESVNSNGKKGGVKFKAILQEAEAPNQNRRIYRQNALTEGLKNMIDFKIKRGICFNEMDHPTTNNPSRFMSVKLKNASHRILSYEWKGNLLEATCQTTSNRIGKDLRALLEEDGINVGFSLRATGKTRINEQTGLTEVHSNLRPVCWDSVSDPSHANALTQQLIESADLSRMLLSESTRMQMLTEAYSGEDFELFTENSNLGRIKYDHESNIVMLINGDQYMSTLLEDYIRDEFRMSFNRLLG